MKFGKTDLIRRINDVVRNGWSNVHIRDLVESLWRDPFSMRTSGFVKEGGTDSLLAAEVSSTIVDAVTTYAIVVEITPKEKKFDFYQFREILTYHKKYAAEVISFDAEEGLHVVYYDFDPDTFEQVLMHIHNPTHDDLLEMMEWVVPITFLYCDAEKHEIIYFGDNRHGSRWNPWIHFAWHQTFNSMRETGLEFTDLVIDGDGDTDTHAQFGVSAGSCFHEDIYATSVAISTPADFPVWYFKAGNLPRISEDSVNSLVVDGLLCYNSGGLVVPATDGYFVMYHIFFTNDILEPFISVIGQDEYATVSQASQMSKIELQQVKDLLPHQNLLHIGTLLFQTSAAFGNAYHARIVSQSFGVLTRWSVVNDGSAATPLQLKNDEETPDPGKVYGTDPVSGIKGWIMPNCQSIQGTQGTTGASVQGTTGTQGATGASVQGTTGSQGTTGASVQGTTGIQGATGASVQGTTGSQGTTGASVQGTTGSQGTTGASVQGTTGSQGTTGASVQGTQGIQGRQGTTGTGIQGATGASVQGTTGSQGTTGASVQGTTGSQGTTGASVQGTQGIQGRQGTTGTGTQGATGSSIQGTTGSQGTTGASVQGTTGSQGTTGASVQGTTGSQGTTGNIAALKYIYIGSGSESRPGATYFKFNNGTISSVTEIYVDDFDFNGNDQSGYTNTWGGSTNIIKGHLTFNSANNLSDSSAVFQINSYTDGSYYIKLGVTYLSGVNFDSNEVMSLLFSRSGNTGSQGTTGTGTQGTTGTGTQGTQGIQGRQGTTGTGTQGTTGTGTQGTQGIQGCQGTTGTGTQGTTGSQGITGTGSQGTTGTGTQGTQGITGSGTQGTQGVQGPIGSDVLLFNNSFSTGPAGTTADVVIFVGANNTYYTISARVEVHIDHGSGDHKFRASYYSAYWAGSYVAYENDNEISEYHNSDNPGIAVELYDEGIYPDFRVHFSGLSTSTTYHYVILVSFLHRTA
jgi:hypothetical protein